MRKKIFYNVKRIIFITICIVFLIQYCPLSVQAQGGGPSPGTPVVPENCWIQNGPAGCHDRESVPSHETHFDALGKGPGLPEAEEGCLTCHASSSHMRFIPNNFFPNTTACDICHGNGTQNAKDNWFAGVYESDGTTLASGFDRWCVGCHDDYGVQSQEDEPFAIAPNIKGDEANNIGYYKTGHNIACSYCHDFGANHIDHEQRSYSTEEPIISYKVGYRLKDVDGADPLVVPRPLGINPQLDTQSFALCFSCHSKYEVLGTSTSKDLWYKDPVETNFFDSESEKNHHFVHLGFDSDHWDSDGDGEKDSRESCTTCHNVHGNLTGPMIRHGELISTPGTDDMVPALDFCYLVPTIDVAEAEFRPDLDPEDPATQAEYEVSAWWTDHTNRATNVYYTIVHANGTAVIEDIDQSEVGSGGEWHSLGTYTFNEGTGGYVVVSNDGVDGYVVADAIRFNRVGGGEDVAVDNKQATYDSTWVLATDMSEQQWDGDYLYHAKQQVCESSGDVEDSFGSCVNFEGRIVYNGVCNACHNAICYPRDPYLGPRFLNEEANSSYTVSVWGGTVTFSEWVISYSDVSNVTIDLSPLGGSSNQQLYDDGDYVTNGDVNAGDDIYTYRATLDGANLEDTNLFLTIKATSAGIEKEISVFLNITDPNSIYIDNLDAEYNLTGGTWPVATDLPEQYLLSYQYNEMGTGADFAKFIPDIPIGKAGQYNIYTWWTASPNRADNAPFEIVYNGGSETIKVNQKQNGGKWYYLGNYSFNEGTGNYVKLSDLANGYVIADAVKFEKGDPPPKPYPIVDNLEATPVGPWTIATDMPDQQYAGSYQLQAAGTGTNTIRFTPQVEESDEGLHNIYAQWTDNPNRASNAPYTIRYYDTVAEDYDYETIYVNQKQNGGKWYYLGNFYLSEGTGNYVELSDNADGYVIADAVNFVKGDPPTGVYPTIDNLDVTPVGPWNIAYDMPDQQYEGSYQYQAAGIGNYTMTFRPNVLTEDAGLHNIYVRWTDNLNRASNAPYKIVYNGGLDETTICVNQKYNGGVWYYLGNFNLSEGTGNYVELSDNANGYVIADAVDFVKGDPSSTVIVDNLNVTFSDGTWVLRSDLPAEQYMDTYHYHAPGNGSKTATFTAQILTAGTYKVYVWYTAYSNRPLDAPYTVYYEGGGPTTFYVNQRVNGGQWVELVQAGDFSFNEGSYNVVLRDCSSGYVIADAVKWELQP